MKSISLDIIRSINDLDLVEWLDHIS